MTKRRRRTLDEFPYRLTERRKELLDNYWDGVKWSSRRIEPLWIPLELVSVGEPDLASCLLVLARTFGTGIEVRLVRRS